MQCLPPCPAPTRWWWMTVSRPFLYLCLYLWLHAYCFFFFFFPPGYVALFDSKTPHRHTCERVFYCVETFLSRLPPQDRSPSINLLSLFFFFIFCPTSFWRDWAASLSSARVQKLFCGSYSVAKWSFDEFVGEKVVSLSYPSVILWPPSLKIILIAKQAYFGMVYWKCSPSSSWNIMFN